jgi:hypothetical protein
MHYVIGEQEEFDMQKELLTRELCHQGLAERLRQSKWPKDRRLEWHVKPE